MSVYKTRSKVMLSIGDAEKAMIKDKARNYRMSVSRFMVIAALNFEPGYKPLNDKDLEVLTQCQ